MKKLLILLVVILAGCATQNVCTEPSVLCDAAAKLDVNLSQVATALKIGNIAGLSQNVYNSKQAYEFIGKVEKELDNLEAIDGDYSMFVKMLLKDFGELPPEVMALFVVLDSDIDLTLPELSIQILNPYDYKLIRKHLNDQKLIIAPFTK